nr:DUF4249 domain-containing protein [uncultured Mucilaginibacter sp.]
MGKNFKYMVCMALFITALSCRKFYAPKVVAADTNVLVVEGVIDPGTDSTIIKLSHTVNISEKTSTKPETGAAVNVEGAGATYHLTEIRNGTYAAAGLNLNKTVKYRLKIHTAKGQDYLSDEMAVKITPPIDTLAYEIKPDGVDITSAAHDPLDTTRYYRWEYQETWRFNSLYESFYKVVGDTLLPRLRTEEDEIYRCWGNHGSNVILLASTANLQHDVLVKNPITFIKAGDEKISIRYTILLKQYALTKEAFAFWTELRKNTETLGSIFDALPSQLSGNIHNVANPSAPVIGFVSISTVTTKRIFIDRIETPFNPEWRTVYPVFNCEVGGAQDPDQYGNNTIKSEIIHGPHYALDASFDDKGHMIAAGYSVGKCVDCTLRGTNKRPAFWK